MTKNATDKTTPVPSAEGATRLYDPLNPPRFGEWVRVGGLESDESDRTTRREARILPPKPLWKKSRVAFIALLLVLVSTLVTAFSLSRRQPNIEDPNSAPRSSSSDKKGSRSVDKSKNKPNRPVKKPMAKSVTQPAGQSKRKSQISSRRKPSAKSGKDSKDAPSFDE